MTDSEKLDLLLEKVGMIETKVTDIQLTLENEIRETFNVWPKDILIYQVERCTILGGSFKKK